MASLAKFTKYSRNLYDLRPGIIYLSKCGAHEKGPYKPGPVPRTEEERRKAAEKYGIPLSKYETYPDDGLGFGDYPKLPLISADAKDEYYPYDLPALKKNFNETFHIHQTIIDETRYNVNKKHRYKMWQMLAAFAVAFFGPIMLIQVFDKPSLRVYLPALAQQWPAEGVVHYDFPPSKNDPVVHKHH